MIDLHIHSTASDGSLAPQQIMALARKSGVKAISITDHDTIEGIRHIAVKDPACHAPEFISGVEISCDPPVDGLSVSSLHILGYGFSVHDIRLNRLLTRLKQARQERNPRIVQKLNAMGLSVTMDEVAAECGTGQAGRPHIAEVLRKKGYVSSFRQAFDNYLAAGRPAYVDKYRVECEKAMETIRSAGGVSVLAHPGLIQAENPSRLEALIKDLVQKGLDGIEVYYTTHSPSQTALFEKLAKEHRLLMTGGTDFHGTFSKGVELGVGSGGLHVGYPLFEALKSRIEQIRETIPAYDILEKNLGHCFSNRRFLAQALCHRSFLNEHSGSDLKDNERLEFLGDAVLGLCTGQMLMERFPEKREGELSKLRSILVSEKGLSDIARAIDLGRFIKLGKGEMLSGGHEKNSILSDTFEAIVAAVYLDQGFTTVFNLVQRLFSPKLSSGSNTDQTRDYKSTLQEFVQETGNPAPVYRLEKESGPDHDKTFEVVVHVLGRHARGIGKTKKAAEQDCARQALAVLNADA